MPQEASEGRRLLRHGQYVPSNPPRGRTILRRGSDCDKIQDSQGNRVRPCIRGSSSTGTRIQEHQVQCEAQSSWKLDTSPSRPQHSQNPQQGHQSQREDNQDNTIRPQGENNQNGPTMISSKTTCRSHHKTSKSDQGRALCYESGQSTDRASASGHQGDSRRGGRPRQLGDFQVASFCPRTTTMLKISEILTSPIQAPQKREMWHLQPKPHDRNVYSETQGRNHHDSQVPKLWKETSRLEYIMPREERADESCNGKSSTTKQNRSTSEHIHVGSTATEYSQPNIHSAPTKQDTSTENKINAVMTQLTEKMQEDQTPQNSTTTSGTDDALETDIRQEEEFAIQEITQNSETSSPLQQITRNRTTNTDRQQTHDHRQERQHPEERRKNSRHSTSCSSLRAGAQETTTTPNGRGGERLDHEGREQLQHQRRGDIDRIALPPYNTVFILQETLMSEDQQFRLPGYQQYSVPKGPNSHGSMTIVRATIPSSEAQAVRIHLANDSLVVYNIYKPPTKRLEAGELLTQATQELVLIAGDFNAHHPTINSTTRMNLDGHHLLELLTDVPEKTLSNTGEPMHILGGTLDLTFISTELVPVAQWEIDDELTSDHFAKTTTLRMELLPPPPRPPPRWNTKKANWKLYQGELEKWFSNYEPAEDIDQLNQDVTGAIQHAAEKVIPKTNPTNRHNKDYWFYNDEGVKLLRAAVQHSRQITQKIREDKWLEWCATFNAHTTQSELWRKLMIATGKIAQISSPPPATTGSKSLSRALCGTAREGDIRNGLLRALNLNKKTWLLCAADAVNRLKLKDTILSKGPDTMSPEYSTPAQWESLPAVFNILQTGTRKADCSPHELRQIAERNMKALTPHNSAVYYTDGSVETTSTKAEAAFTIEGGNTSLWRTSDGCSTLQVKLAAILGALRHASINSQQGIILHTDS
ncbi:putative RNA-directed DNA polymerase from mobile element jockey-like 52, partial [Homarus americanus]